MPREWLIAKIKELGFEKSLLRTPRHEIYRRGRKDMIFVPEDPTLSEIWIRETLRLKAGLSEEEITQFLTFH